MDFALSPRAARLVNCSAPDTGNMEVLLRYGDALYLDWRCRRLIREHERATPAGADE